MTDSLVRALVDLRDRQIQKARIQFGNRVDAILRDADQANAQQLALAEKYNERFVALEKELDRDIHKAVAPIPIYQHLSQIKGIGPLLAAKLIAMIDIERSPHISSLWRYAGYAVIEGERERPKKGEKLHYNARLKTALYLVGTSFLRTGSPYREEYDRARAYYEAKRPDWTKAHQHQAAMRKMIKLFLSHLWVRWRTLEGLPVTEPYVQAKLGHTHILPPEDFGWPSI